MKLYIDPGTTESAYVVLVGGHMAAHGKMANADLTEMISGGAFTMIVCEMIASYGMAVGAEVFETCVWIGEFRHACQSKGGHWETITRIEVKKRLCFKTAGVNDGVIRQRLIDLYGGKAVAIGNKANPGPLYGIKADVWAALAVAKAWEMAA